MLYAFTLLKNPKDRHKFNSLYTEYYDLVKWIAKRRLNSSQLANDCAQETFIYLERNFCKIGEVKSPSTKKYVALIADSFAIKLYNAEKKQTLPIDENIYVETEAVDFNAFQVIEIKEAIGMLPDELRNFLYLKYVYGYKSAEIASIYGMSDALVRKKLELARKQLKNIMERED